MNDKQLKYIKKHSLQFPNSSSVYNKWPLTYL